MLICLLLIIFAECLRPLGRSHLSPKLAITYLLMFSLESLLPRIWGSAFLTQITRTLCGRFCPLKFLPIRVNSGACLHPFCGPRSSEKALVSDRGGTRPPPGALPILTVWVLERHWDCLSFSSQTCLREFSAILRDLKVTDRVVWPCPGYTPSSA